MPLLLFIALVSALSSCHLIDNKSKTTFNSQPESMRVYDFCDPELADKVWIRPEIESKLTSLVDNPPVYNTIMESYPHAYITMTGERDKARCGDGPLVSGYVISNYINHLLSDVMTRYLYKITKDCAQNPSLSVENYGLCYNQKKFQEDPKLDSLSAFLESTSVYISSHIALSLSAVLLDDSFWNRSNLSMTHAKGNGLIAVRNRSFYVKRYKVNYDAFNDFLAVNLKTVSKALSDECLISGDFLVLAAKLGQKIPISASLFEKIRTRSFNEALDLAVLFADDPSQHPMIVKNDDVFEVDYAQYDYNYKYNEKLRNLEGYAKRAMVNPIGTAIYNNVLGGLNNSELQKTRQACKTK